MAKKVEKMLVYQASNGAVEVHLDEGNETVLLTQQQVAQLFDVQKAGILNSSRVSPETLTTLTLLVAESKPADKDRMIGLILMLLKK